MRKDSELAKVVEAIKDRQRLAKGIRELSDDSGVAYPTIYKVLAGAECMYSTIDKLYIYFFCSKNKLKRKP